MSEMCTSFVSLLCGRLQTFRLHQKEVLTRWNNSLKRWSWLWGCGTNWTGTRTAQVRCLQPNFHENGRKTKRVTVDLEDQEHEAQHGPDSECYRTGGLVHYSTSTSLISARHLILISSVRHTVAAQRDLWPHLPGTVGGTRRNPQPQHRWRI